MAGVTIDDVEALMSVQLDALNSGSPPYNVDRLTKAVDKYIARNTEAGYNPLKTYYYLAKIAYFDAANAAHITDPAAAAGAAGGGAAAAGVAAAGVAPVAPLDPAALAALNTGLIQKIERVLTEMGGYPGKAANINTRIANIKLNSPTTVNRLLKDLKTRIIAAKNTDKDLTGVYFHKIADVISRAIDPLEAHINALAAAAAPPPTQAEIDELVNNMLIAFSLIHKVASDASAGSAPPPPGSSAPPPPGSSAPPPPPPAKINTLVTQITNRAGAINTKLNTMKTSSETLVAEGNKLVDRLTALKDSILASGAPLQADQLATITALVDTTFSGLNTKLATVEGSTEAELRKTIDKMTEALAAIEAAQTAAQGLGAGNAAQRAANAAVNAERKRVTLEKQAKSRESIPGWIAELKRESSKIGVLGPNDTEYIRIFTYLKNILLTDYSLLTDDVIQRAIVIVVSYTLKNDKEYGTLDRPQLEGLLDRSSLLKTTLKLNPENKILIKRFLENVAPQAKAAASAAAGGAAAAAAGAPGNMNIITGLEKITPVYTFMKLDTYNNMKPLLQGITINDASIKNSTVQRAIKKVGEYIKNLSNDPKISFTFPMVAAGAGAAAPKYTTKTFKELIGEVLKDLTKTAEIKDFIENLPTIGDAPKSPPIRNIATGIVTQGGNRTRRRHKTATKKYGKKGKTTLKRKGTKKQKQRR